MLRPFIGQGGLVATSSDHVRRIRSKFAPWAGRVLTVTTAAALVFVFALALPAAAVDTDMAISTTALDFGEVNVGATATLSVTLTNTGGDPFGPINMFGGAPPTAEFNASQNCQAQTLPAGGSCMVNYSFTPGAAGTFSDTSNFTVSETMNQADGEAFSVSMTGIGCDPSGCLPTITSFTPASGPVGTSVAITGTRLTGATAVRFGGVAATTFVVNSATSISATVPAGAVTGRIVVTAPAGTATSATDFTVTVEEHFRAISLSMSGHLIAHGRVSSDLEGCESGVTVTVQRRKPGAGWRDVGTATTRPDGKYRTQVRDRVGRYRASVAEETIGTSDVCPAETSNRQQHRH
jgi:hypothetical protein